MKILVTGGAGYIGSVTAELLLDAGHSVTVLDNLERGHRAAVDRRARFVQADLRDAGTVEREVGSLRPDAVMHFAAYALVAESMARPETYFGNNVVGGLNLANAMLRHGTRRLVFSSTCATYGNPERVPITEDLPQKPRNPYGESKLMFERILEWLGRTYGLQAVFLRYFNAAGATERCGEDHEPETHLIPAVLKTALGQREKVIVHGGDYDTPDGTCIRDYIHVADLARAHILALADNLEGAFNLGNGQGYSVRQVIDTARAVTGRSFPVEVGARRPGDPAVLVSSTARVRAALGWTPECPDLARIIESAWRWHLAHPHGYESA